MGVRPRTLVSWLIVHLTGSLEVAFSRHVAWLATIQAKLVLEVSVLLLLGEFLEFLGKSIDLSAILFCCGGTVLESSLRSTGASSEGGVTVQPPYAVEFSGFFNYVIQCSKLGGYSYYLLMQGLRERFPKGQHLGFFICSRSRSIGGPFLVPFTEMACAHS